MKIKDNANSEQENGEKNHHNLATLIKYTQNICILMRVTCSVALDIYWH